MWCTTERLGSKVCRALRGLLAALFGFFSLPVNGGGVAHFPFFSCLASERVGKKKSAFPGSLLRRAGSLCTPDANQKIRENLVQVAVGVGLQVATGVGVVGRRNPCSPPPLSWEKSPHRRLFLLWTGSQDVQNLAHFVLQGVQDDRELEVTLRPVTQRKARAAVSVSGPFQADVVRRRAAPAPAWMLAALVLAVVAHCQESKEEEDERLSGAGCAGKFNLVHLPGSCSW